MGSRVAKVAHMADCLRRFYSPSIQLSLTQIEVIAGAILARGPACNLLVFGCGHDSALWSALNAGGRTVFVEGAPEWAARAREADASLHVELVDFADASVAESLRWPLAMPAPADVPSFMAGCDWDVVLIDGPPGYKPTLPGRALPIAWTAAVRKPSTHVFVDDYQRELERTYSDRLLREGGAGCATVRRQQGRPQELFWSIGRREGGGGS